MTAIPFYDISADTADEQGWLDIERVYCFDWDAFDLSLMERLRALFESLPKSRKQDAGGCHWWFSDHEDLDNGYLTAGVEPPGLHVFGTLPLSSWLSWDEAFQRAAHGFPCRVLG